MYTFFPGTNKIFTQCTLIWTAPICSACVYFLPGTNIKFTQCLTFCPRTNFFLQTTPAQLSASSEPNSTPAAGQSGPCTVWHIQGSNRYSTHFACKTAFKFSSGTQLLHTGIQDDSLPLRCRPGGVSKCRASRCTTQASNEARKGAMYHFGSSPVDIAMDMEEIQHPPPPFRSLYLSRHPCDNLTYFELETSELDNRCEILQVVTCLFSNPDVSFSVYVLSTTQISRDATAVIHFSLARASGHNVLPRNGIKVLAVCWSVAEEFFFRICHITIHPCCTQLILFLCMCYCSTHQAHSATTFQGLNGNR